MDETLALFETAFFAFATDFQRNKQNNPAEHPVTDTRRPVARGVELEKMNYPPVIPKSERGAAFTMRFRAIVSRRNKQGLIRSSTSKLLHDRFHRCTLW